MLNMGIRSHKHQHQLKHCLCSSLDSGNEYYTVIIIFHALKQIRLDDFKYFYQIRNARVQVLDFERKLGLFICDDVVKLMTLFIVYIFLVKRDFLLLLALMLVWILDTIEQNCLPRD